MAGDWIKMRNDLPDDPAVIAIAARLGIDEFAVIGRLHTLWAWADEQSRDGHAVGVTSAWLDRKVQRDGFADAMVSVGWLVVSAGGLTIPNFENHNGETAKTRALGTRRKQRQRAGVTVRSVPPVVPPVVTQVSREVSREVSRSQRDKSETREEKRREEIPPTPKGVTVHRFPPGFEEFWSAYPKKVGKDAAAKAFAKRKPDAELLASMLKAISQQRESEQWRKDRGQYIPNPETWLNQGRWQDEVPKVEDDIFAGAR